MAKVFKVWSVKPLYQKSPRALDKNTDFRAPPAYRTRMEVRPENLHTSKHPDMGPSLRGPGKKRVRRENSPLC